MVKDRGFNPKRVRMQLETDPDQTIDLKALLLSLAQQVVIIRKAPKSSKKSQQVKFGWPEPATPIAPFDADDWRDLNVRDAICVYSRKGIRFRFTVDSHSPRFLPLLEELIFRFIPFKVYDILNEEEVHNS